MSKQSTFKFSLMLLASLGLVLQAADAQAFKVRQTKNGKVIMWCSSKVVVHLDTTHVKKVPGLVDAVRSSFASWTSYGMPTKVELRMSTKRLKANASDNVNSVLWLKGNWPYEAHRVAKTLFRYGSSTGCIKEADIVLNAKVFAWAVFSNKHNTVSDYDVENVMAHEVGHFFGLAHSDTGEATMWPTTPKGETSKRSLSQDDINGIASLVQNSSGRVKVTPDNVGGTTTDTTGDLDTEDYRGGCAVATGDPRKVPVLIIVMGLLMALRRRRR